jgi:hypothetical protein
MECMAGRFHRRRLLHRSAGGELLFYYIQTEGSNYCSVLVFLCETEQFHGTGLFCGTERLDPKQSVVPEPPLKHRPTASAHCGGTDPAGENRSVRSVWSAH